jgi:hypothetical protein
MSVIDIYLYVLRDIEIYQSGLFWFQSVLSHGLTQIVFIKTAVEVIDIETENGNLPQIYFTVGKIVGKLMQYKPLEFASLEEPDNAL